MDARCGWNKDALSHLGPDSGCLSLWYCGQPTARRTDSRRPRDNLQRNGMPRSMMRRLLTPLLAILIAVSLSAQTIQQGPTLAKGPTIQTFGAAAGGGVARVQLAASCLN